MSKAGRSGQGRLQREKDAPASPRPSPEEPSVLLLRGASRAAAAAGPVPIATDSPYRAGKAAAEERPGPPQGPPPLPDPVMYPAGSGAAPASPPARESRGDCGSFPGLGRGNKTNKSPSLMEKNDFVPGIYGTSLPLSRFTHQAQYNCSLDLDGSAENKLNSPGDKAVAGGVLGSMFYKDHYKAAVEQLAALSLSKNTRRAQLNPNSIKQGAFHSWSYMYHQGNNSVSRDFNKTFAEMPSSSSDIPLSFIKTHPALVGSHPVNTYQSGSYLGTQQTLENCSTNGDGDFFKNSNSYLPTDSSSDDTLSVTKLNWKTGDSHREDKLSAEEKDASEGAKNRAVLIKYLKNANLKLRPEPIEDVETSSSAECETFPYPDFLPEPYNTLDLQKLSLSKGDDWKLAFEPPLDKLISRLVEMERLQNLTILKERTKEPSASPTMSNRPISTKDTYQLKQLKAIDLLCPQAAFDGDFRNPGSHVQETDISKWTCHHCHHKWNSGTLRSKHLRASCNKSIKAPVILDPSNAATRRSLSGSGSSAKVPSAVKMPSPNTPAVFSLPDSESSKCKLPRTRRKSCRNNVSLMGKSFSSHRLKSLSILAKPKYSQVDHQ